MSAVTCYFLLVSCWCSLFRAAISDSLFQTIFFKILANNTQKNIKLHGDSVTLNFQERRIRINYEKQQLVEFFSRFAQ
jgi:hypothetical protein